MITDGVSGHEDGHVSVTYDSTGQHIITGGTDGDVRIYKSVDDKLPQSFYVQSFSITHILHANDSLFTASDSWSLQQWTFPEGLPDGILAKFSGNVTHFSFNTSKTHVIVGSEDFLLKLTDVKTQEQSIIKGHNAPVLRTAFGTKYFSSSSCDGTLRIWSADSKECLKKLDIYPKSNSVDMSKVRGGIVFDKSENLITALESEVVIYSSGGWSESCRLKSSDTSSTILEIALSHCYQYLLVGYKDGSIIVWDLSARTQINKTKTISTPSSFGVHPSKYSVVIGDDKGCWREWSPYLTEQMKESKGSTIMEEGTEVPDNFFDDEALDDDWEDKEDIMNIDRDEEDVTNAVISSNARIFDDDDDDDEPSIAQMAKLPERPVTPEIEKQSEQADAEQAYVGPELQDAFQVASTPEHLRHRYLVWNDVGIIVAHDVEDEPATINIDFHDTATHHPMHLANPQGYSLGSMSLTALALATTGTDEGAKCSSLMVNTFSSWTNNKDWSTSLPSGENILLLAVSNKFVTVVTDRLYVRTWSVGGLQRHVFSIAGAPVTLASHNNLLSILHYQGTSLCLSLYDINKPSLLYNGPCPVTPSASVAWAGFTQGGLPLVYDSEGVLRALLPHAGLMWVPIADLHSKKKSSDTYWITAVTETQIRCVLCKGVSYPGLVPRPMLSLLPHSVPLCDVGTERTGLEQTRALSHVRRYNIQKLNTFEKECRQEDLEKEEVTMLIKLLALAVKNNKDYKALELAKMMPNKQSLELAARYCSKSGHVQLAERINKLLRTYDQEEEEEEAEEDLFITSTVEYIAETHTIPSPAVSAPSLKLSNSKKRKTQIDESIAPMRFTTSKPAPKPAPPPPVEDVFEEPVPDNSPVKSTPSSRPSSTHDIPANPFSVKSTDIQNTQRRSTSFLETIETKSIDIEQKRKSVQNTLFGKPATVSVQDLAKKASKASPFAAFSQSKGKAVNGEKPSAKPKARPNAGGRKKTGYMLWFEAQGNTSEEFAKSAPSVWRALGGEEKKVWLDKGKAQENEEEKGKAEGYKLWLASDPKCNDTDWVAKCAPTKWKIMAGDKKKTWIDKAKLGGTPEVEDSPKKDLQGEPGGQEAVEGAEKKKISGFHLWVETQEDKESSLKKWRTLTSSEKAEWIEKAKVLNEGKGNEKENEEETEKENDKENEKENEPVTTEDTEQEVTEKKRKHSADIEPEPAKKQATDVSTKDVTTKDVSTKDVSKDVSTKDVSKDVSGKTLSKLAQFQFSKKSQS